MTRPIELHCVKCGRVYHPDDVLYTCQQCGVEGILDVRLDYDAIRRQLNRESLRANADFSLWRYLPAIPLADRRGIQPLQVGWTPLYALDSLAAAAGLRHLLIKDDSRNPTASLKDRASAVGVAKAIELGRTVLCAASTGNAASSLAGFAASAGLETYIFVPENAPEAKVTQLLIFGAHVFLVQGNYDEAFDLCQAAAEAFGWYNRSCAVNPYLVEGKKTVAYEICEQLGWQVPDIAVVAVGDGCTIAGVWKGFKECLTLGLTDRLPVLVGVQASGANPVSRAFSRQTEQFDYIRPQTIADSIAVGIPRNGLKALRAVQESGGFMVDVTDDDILAAMRLLARKTGIFGEPSGVTGLAGILRLCERGRLSGRESIISIVSGSGLKDIRSARLAANSQAVAVTPDLAAVRAIIAGHEERRHEQE